MLAFMQASCGIDWEELSVIVCALASHRLVLGFEKRALPTKPASIQAQFNPSQPLPITANTSLHEASAHQITGHSSQLKPRQAGMKPMQITSLATLPNQSQDKPA